MTLYADPGGPCLSMLRRRVTSARAERPQSASRNSASAGARRVSMQTPGDKLALGFFLPGARAPEASPLDRAAHSPASASGSSPPSNSSTRSKRKSTRASPGRSRRGSSNDRASSARSVAVIARPTCCNPICLRSTPVRFKTISLAPETPFPAIARTRRSGVRRLRVSAQRRVAGLAGTQGGGTSRDSARHGLKFWNGAAQYEMSALQQH